VDKDRIGVTTRLFGFIGNGGAARAATRPKGLIGVISDAALKGPLFHGGAQDSGGNRLGRRRPRNVGVYHSGFRRRASS